MGHMCGSNCKRKTGRRCETCRRPGGRGKRASVQIKRGAGRPKGALGVTPKVQGAAMDMYFDGLSYRKVAENVGDYFDKPVTPTTVYRWVQSSGAMGRRATADYPIRTGDVWVADEMPGHGRRSQILAVQRHGLQDTLSACGVSLEGANDAGGSDHNGDGAG